jgi:catechol 2,3-dioxygenase-like lactoylglutathione lyase family enzyme
MRILGIDHVQLAMPPGREEEARAFYERLLGLPEVPKPAEKAKRGGCWFERGAVKVHLGVEQDFRPARKAHPALRVADLDGLVRRLADAGHPCRDGDTLNEGRSVYVDVPFGNRIELIGSASDPR